VEQLIPLAEEAGLSMPHLAMAFAISHPGVTSALLGARTMEQLDDLLAGVDTVLSDDVLDRIDEIVPPGTDIGTLDQAYVPPPAQRALGRLKHAPPRPRSCYRKPPGAGPPKDRAFISEAGRYPDTAHASFEIRTDRYGRTAAPGSRPRYGNDPALPPTCPAKRDHASARPAREKAH